MTQKIYDSILSRLQLGLIDANDVTEDTERLYEIEQFKKLWRKHLEYRGAILYSKTPEIHIHCKGDKEK